MPAVAPERLGIYADAVYPIVQTPDGPRISVDRASLIFACEVGRRFRETLLFGRASPTNTASDYLLPQGVKLVELPHYGSLYRLLDVGRATLGTLVGMWRGLGRIDTVWAWGPHPFSLVLIALAVARRKRVVLCIRQETLPYYRSRLPNRRWLPVLGPIWMLEAAYRLLARRLPTTVVGPGIARRYGGERPSLLPMKISLVEASDVAHPGPDRDWGDKITLLTVGRLEPEKNPLLLVEALGRLERDHPGRYRAVWIGRGRLERAVLDRAAELRLSEMLDLRGYVPFGPELLELYRRAHVFVHVSLTEGMPQVLVEALAMGTPVIATDVGGVRALLDEGRAGLLVRPGDVEELVAAIQRLVGDPGLRKAIVTHGLEIARHSTIEVEAERVARFVAATT